MNIKTITSVDGVNTVDFGSAASRFYWFKNIGTTTVYVSGDPDITAGGDGVAELAAGGSVCIETLGGKVYVLGAGKVQIHNTGDKFCPFRNAPVSSGGGVIIPLNVVEPGSYWAKDYGCDGFDPVNVNVPDNYDEGYDKGYEDGWEVSAGYYDGSGASTDKPYLLHVYVDTVSIPGYQNTNPVVFDIYEKKDGAWSIVKESTHYVNDNAQYSYDTKINYIKLSSEYGKPSYVGLTGWTKDHSISHTEVFNYNNALVYGVSSKNCALTSVAPTA